FLLDLDHEFLRWRKCETQFAGRALLRLLGLFRLLRRQRNQFDLRNFVPGLARHHHLVELQRGRIRARSVEKGLEGLGVLRFECSFVFLRKSFLVSSGRSPQTNTRNKQQDGSEEFHRLVWLNRKDNDLPLETAILFPKTLV